MRSIIFNYKPNMYTYLSTDVWRVVINFSPNTDKEILLKTSIAGSPSGRLVK